MNDDRQLLRQFTQHNSQEAFAALTARYLNLVYSTCRRELDDADLAEDVTQAVFLILARKAPTLRREVVLSGWLFQTARFAAKNARTQEQRRKAAEQKAAEAMPPTTEDAAWSELEPLLNQSLARLKDSERECVLLRFFQGMSFAEAGAALGLSEEAARKRVTRALDKMRQFLVKNGVVVPATALAALLTTHAAKAAPVGLAPAIAKSTVGVLAGHTTTAALTGSHAYKLSEGIVKTMKIVHIKIAVGIATAVMVVGAGTYGVVRSAASTQYIHAQKNADNYRKAHYIPSEGIGDSDTGGIVPGNPEAAAKNLSQIYQWIKVYRTRHGQNTYPNATQLIRDIGQDQFSAGQYGVDNHSSKMLKNILSVFMSPDAKFADDVSARNHSESSIIYNFPKMRPDGSPLGNPKPEGTRDVLAFTDIYFHRNVRQFRGDNASTNPVGFYLVLWDNGAIQRIAYDYLLFIPKGDGDIDYAFPGQAGLPANALSYSDFYTKYLHFKHAPHGILKG